MSNEQNSGNSLYYPAKEVIKKARVKDYEKLYKESITNREGFWPKRQKNFTGTRNGIKSLTIVKNPFSSGSQEAKQTL